MCESSDVGNAGIHISCTDGMTHCLVLIKDGLVALRVFLTDVCLATEVEQILCLVQITLLTGESVEACECHLCYLMARHYSSLT